MSERPTRLPPVDEAAEEPELVAFRAKVLAAIAAKDWPALEETMFWRAGFGPDYQDAKRRRLGEFWGMPSPDSPMWWKMERALRWGGRFNSGRVLHAPGLDLAWPEGYDPRRWLVAAGPEVPMREAPSPSAQVTAWLSYDLVEYVPIPGREDAPFPYDYDWHTNRADHGPPGYSAEGFHHVRAVDGRTGWVDHHQLISPLEHQVYISKVEDRWWGQIVAFVAPGADQTVPAFLAPWKASPTAQ